MGSSNLKANKKETMHKFVLVPAFLFLIVVSLVAQRPLEQVSHFRKANEHAMLSEYFQFLNIPNRASDKENIDRNATFIEDMLKKRGVQTRLLEANTPGTPKVVYGTVDVPGAQRTIIFYAHYDGQPVNAERWHPSVQPHVPLLLSNSVANGGAVLPFPDKNTPINPDWRISCRSSADDKSGVMAIIQAYDAIAKSGLKPTSNIRFFFEGEEEIGSLHLDEILEKHKALLKSDLWIVADGPVHQTGLPLIDFGVRGDVNVHLTVYGPKRPLHSGHYGNWAPNPCLMLSKLLASMKDDEGRVIIKGYNEDAIRYSESERKAFEAMPSPDEQMKRELGIKTPEGAGIRIFEAYELPSLNINGIRCADVGDKASNVIPTSADAALDLRQVLGTDYMKQIELVRQHIRDQGYYVIDREPTDEERLAHAKIARLTVGNGGYNAQRTPLDLPVSRQVIRAVQSATTKQVLIQPTAGGSLPLYLFEKYLDAKVINLCITNHDSNQHSENENLRIGYLWDAIDQLAAIMLME